MRELTHKEDFASRDLPPMLGVDIRSDSTPAVLKAAHRVGGAWARLTGSSPAVRKKREVLYAKAVANLDKELQQVDTASLRGWCVIELVQAPSIYSAATGDAAPALAGASRIVNERAIIELQQRAAEWRAQFDDAAFIIDS